MADARGPKVAAKNRVSFDRDALIALFSGPVHASGARPKGGGGEAAFWLPILAVATGARLEELAQLRVTDIDCRSVPGACILDILTRDDEGRVKSDSSRRRVPLHPIVVDHLAFSAYLDTLPRTGMLFPNLKAPVGGHNRSGNWSKWFGRYRRTIPETAGPKTVFHSLRHTFKDLCREALIQQEVHDRLTGHAPQNVGGTYGMGHPDAVLFTEISKLNLEAVFRPLLAK